MDRNTKIFLKLLLIFILTSFFYSCCQLKIDIKNATFYELYRSLEITNGNAILECTETDNLYYYHISTVFRNTSRDTLYIDMSSFKLKIKNDSLDLYVCYDHSVISNLGDTLIILPNSLMNLSFYNETSKRFIELKNTTMDQDFYINYKTYMQLLNRNVTLEFQSFHKNSINFKIKVNNFKSINESEQIYQFGLQNKCDTQQHPN